ncbi:MAG: alpha/beta hydrolase [Anaerolineae bacterium]
MDWYDAELARLSDHIPLETLTVPTRCGPTHLIAAGPEAARPVMLIIGLGGCSLVWFHQIVRLAERFRVYTPDTPGQPGRSAAARPGHRGPDFGWWVEDMLDGLHLPAVSLVGWSLGARIAIKACSVMPERVERLSLICPIGLGRVRLGLTLQVLPIAFGAADRQARMRRILAGLLSGSGAAAMRPDLANVLEWFALVGEHYRQEGLSTGTAMLFPLPSDELAACTMPTQLLVGENEALFRAEAVVAHARRHLPNLHHVCQIPGAGHLAAYEAPQTVNEHLEGFMSGG